MFAKRRPVPSAKTVRLLYQLGYICSGTAVGLATLCLEEQRRRIQILQRIADNAKIIRQHPRYRGNAALAVETGDNSGWGAIEGGWTPERSGRRRRRRYDEPNGANDGAVEDPSLPSVVEREYSQLFGRGQGSLGKRVVLPQFRQAPRILDLGRQGEYEPAPDVSPPQEETLSTRMSTAASPYPKSLQEMRAPAALNELKSDFYRTLKWPRYVKSAIESDLIEDEPGLSSASLDAAEAFSQNGAEPQPLPTSRWHGEASRELKPISVFNEPFSAGISSDDLSHDINLFLSAGAPDHPESNVAISTKFFRWAVTIGSLDDIRAMLQWKLANNLFTNHDARVLYRAGSALSDQHNHQELSGLFTAMFTSNDFSQLNTGVRMKLALTVLGSSIKWKLDEQPSSLQHAILGEFFCDAENDVVASVLGNVCKDFLSSGDSSVAAELFVLVTKSRRYQKDFDALADDLFHAIIVGGSITHCAPLLRWKATHVKNEDLMPLLNSFVQACGNRKAYRLLANLLGKKSGLRIPTKRLVEGLDSDNRAVLSMALSTGTGTRQAFEQLYSSLPLSMRSVVHESTMAELRFLWRTTRNFEKLDRRISVLLDNFEESGNEEARRELDETALEIYISAGKTDLALKTITRMHKTNGASNLAMCQTALMFAKQGSWNSFTRLIEILRDAPSFVFDAATTRVFNAVVYVYCQQHSAEESWDFTSAAIRELCFFPNRSTLDILLQHFVITERFELISKWIAFLDASGHSMSLDAHTVSNMLRRYYVTHRPSHIFMMWLCRKLALTSPSFASEQLNYIVQHAIAYDLRHLSGRQASWQQLHAEIRLKRLRDSAIFVPSPGFVWNEQLYFHDSGEVHDKQTTTPKQKEPRILHSNETEDVTENSGDVSDTSLDFVTGFEALRSSKEESNIPPDLEDVNTFSITGQKKVEGRMWLHLTCGRYQQVLDLYHENLDAVGIPASPVLLEIAVEASLRMHKGDRSKADEIMSKAREAGMNTTCATGPLIIHELRQLHLGTEIDVGYLQKAVIEYYKSNDENGQRVMHYVGVSAANLLISSRYTHHGLDILSSIYTSRSGQERPLDIVGMTVFLKGYIKIQSLDGIRWVVQTVLDGNIRMTKPFIKQLRFLKKGGFKRMSKHPRDVHPMLESWIQLCEARLKEQTAETHTLGWELVKQIAKCSKGTSGIDIDAPNYLEERSLGDRDVDAESSVDSDFIDESYYSDETLNESGEQDGIAEFRRRIIEDWNAEKRFRQRMKRAALAQGTWDKDRPLVLPETYSEGHLRPQTLDSESQVTAPWTADDPHNFADESKENTAIQRSVTIERREPEMDDEDEDLAVFRPLS